MHRDGKNIQAPHSSFPSVPGRTHPTNRNLRREHWQLTPANRSRQPDIKRAANQNTAHPEPARSVSTGFHIACWVFCALQRNLLETGAFIDYLECRARTVDRAEAASMTKTDHQNATLDGTTDRTDSIGTFIYSHDNLFHCKSLGIDYWLIRLYNLVLQTPIKDITYLTHPDHIGLSIQHSRDSVCIFTGTASDPRLYRAINGFIDNLMAYPDPFNAISLPEFIPPSTSNVSATYSQRHRALTAKERFEKTWSPCKCPVRHLFWYLYIIIPDARSKTSKSSQ